MLKGGKDPLQFDFCRTLLKHTDHSVDALMQDWFVQTPFWEKYSRCHRRRQGIVHCISCMQSLLFCTYSSIRNGIGKSSDLENRLRKLWDSDIIYTVVLGRNSSHVNQQTSIKSCNVKWLAEDFTAKAMGFTSCYTTRDRQKEASHKLLTLFLMRTGYRCSDVSGFSDL